VAIVYPESDDGRASALGAFDQGQAAMAMMIVAADLGIGSGHSAVGDHDLARRVLGYPEDHRCDMMIAFAYPADRPLRPIEHPKRRPMDEVVHRGRW
jgi:nitroreductase